MTNLQEDTNGSQGQIMPPGTISQNVPDTPPPAFESDSYNKGGDLSTEKPSDLGSRFAYAPFYYGKSKRKPLDWVSIASEAARTGLKFMKICLASGITYAAVLWLNWLANLLPGNLGISAKIGLAFVIVALIGAGVGAGNSYYRQRNP